MKHHLNSLFITTQGSYLAKEGEAVLVRHEKQTKARVPIHMLGSIVCFGRVGFSPALAGLCGERGVTISLCTEHGRFLARVCGYTSGNVLLRRTQYRWADDPARSAAVARSIVIGKIANARQVLMRSVRDYPVAPGTPAVEATAALLGNVTAAIPPEIDLDRLRGIEGDAAGNYFGVFDHLVTAQKDAFAFTSRSRRPPLDRVNALLSFVYALLAADARTACEAAGLDAAVGFLHRDRPGRPGLALDLMEEFRPYLADRLVLSLVNRRQVDAGGFEVTASGAVAMNDATRKIVLVAWQKRKQELVQHPFIGEKTTVGLLIHLQARLLARHLRGDLDVYPPFIWK
ncbi:MAG TPA: type I-C CRISPR-associated endonuclease Cas1c [Tepidisphaeraceae bacterium]|jgi:CRISPR-associated protein Cas1